MKRLVKSFLARFFPRQLTAIQIYLLYSRAAQAMGYQNEMRRIEFKKLVNSLEGKDCLQVGVRKQKVRNSWVSIDLFDTAPYIDFNYDVQDMQFEDESFDFIYCPAILEHVPYPHKAVAEFLRVLRPGGLVWVEIPFNQPYHPNPQDYWRVSPQGMSVLMEDFEEVLSGVGSDENNILFNFIFFLGRKPISIK